MKRLAEDIDINSSKRRKLEISYLNDPFNLGNNLHKDYYSRDEVASIINNRETTLYNYFQSFIKSSCFSFPPWVLAY